MNLKKSFAGFLVVGALFVTATPASAQFGKLLGGGEKGSSVDPAKALAAGSDVIGYVTLATMLANDAADLLVDMYPPEKVEEIKKLSMQTAELRAKTKAGDYDAEQTKAFEDKSALLAKLQADGKLNDYKKDKAGNVTKAYAKLGLALLADGAAALKLKPAVDGLQAAVQQISKNPLQAGKLGQVTSQVTTLATVGVALPKQVSSASTVRSICSQIAAAEKVTLTADPSADKVKDLASLTTQSQSIN